LLKNEFTLNYHVKEYHLNTIPNLEFLAAKSKELLSRQIGAYEKRRSYAGTLLAVLTFFIPVFFGKVERSVLPTPLLSAAAVVFFLISLILLIIIFISYRLDEGMSFSKLVEHATLDDYKTTLTFEIGANESSYTDNRKVVKRNSNLFSLSIFALIAGIILSVAAFVYDKFITPSVEKATKVEIIKAVPFNITNADSLSTQQLPFQKDTSFKK
jgi:formate/nitrite transporter FocA (FNT family)